MNYNNLFEVTKIYDNNIFEKLYNESICKTILNYTEFVQIFTDIYNHLINLEYTEYYELFNNENLINNGNNIIKKYGVEKIILLNKIFNFLLFDEKLYKNYKLITIIYFVNNN